MLEYAPPAHLWRCAIHSQNGHSRGVQPYPQFVLGADARDYRYRYNWNPPVIVSQHDKQSIYFGSNILLRSKDRGNSWQEISPDLTCNDDAKHGRGGVPYTNEAASGWDGDRCVLLRGPAGGRFASLFTVWDDEQEAREFEQAVRGLLPGIAEAKGRGAAILGIFHDAPARAQVCDREVDVSVFSPA